MDAGECKEKGEGEGVEREGRVGWWVPWGGVDIVVSSVCLGGTLSKGGC